MKKTILIPISIYLVKLCSEGSSSVAFNNMKSVVSSCETNLKNLINTNLTLLFNTSENSLNDVFLIKRYAGHGSYFENLPEARHVLWWFSDLCGKVECGSQPTELAQGIE